MKHATLLGALAATLVGVIAYGQPSRADLDRARDQQRLRAQPTYSHSPVYATWGDVSVNLHTITAYHPSEAGGTVIYPGGTMIAVPHEEFDAVVKRASRVMVWRPGVP